MPHHAVVIEAQKEAGIIHALALVARELGLAPKGNPDVVVFRYGLFSVEDARSLEQRASEAPFAGTTRAFIVSADRIYHEAQNALLKLLEEPTRGTHLFFIVPTVGNLLPTVRSRVEIVRIRDHSDAVRTKPLGTDAREFIGGGKREREKIVTALTGGTDDEDRRRKRDEAIELINGIERAAHDRASRAGRTKPLIELMRELETLRGYLYDRSSPVKLMLEHLSVVTPSDLL